MNASVKESPTAKALLSQWKAAVLDLRSAYRQTSGDTDRSAQKLSKAVGGAVRALNALVGRDTADAMRKDAMDRMDGVAAIKAADKKEEIKPPVRFGAVTAKNEVKAIASTPVVIKPKDTLLRGETGRAPVPARNSIVVAPNTMMESKTSPEKTKPAPAQAEGKPQPQLLDSVLAELLRLRKLGHSNRTCAKLMGKPHGTISGLTVKLKALGYDTSCPPESMPKRGGTPRFTDEQLLEELGRGVSRSDCAAKFDVSRSAIDMRVSKLKRAGVSLPSQGCPTPELPSAPNMALTTKTAENHLVHGRTNAPVSTIATVATVDIPTVTVPQALKPPPNSHTIAGGLTVLSAAEEKNHFKPQGIIIPGDARVPTGNPSFGPCDLAADHRATDHPDQTIDPDDPASWPVETESVVKLQSAPATAPLLRDHTKAGKPRFDLLASLSTTEDLVARVLTFGAIKHKPEGWRQIADAKLVYLAAARRHLNAWSKGEKNDLESGLPHLAHAVTNLMFLTELEALGRVNAGTSS